MLAHFALEALSTSAAPQAQVAEEGEISSTSLSAPGDATEPNAYHRERSVSREVSLNPKHAPARSIDVLVRWLNSYAIAARDMPAELAGNALSLIESVSRTTGSQGMLPSSDIVKCLEGVVRREVNGPTEQVLRDAAKRNLERLTSS